MNKMFKKIVATTAVVSTVACLSVSAFATTADYDKATQKVKLTDWAASGEGQYTIVVVPKTWDGSDEDIYYINQDSETGMATLVNGMGVKTDLYALADAEADDTAEFQVWVGSDVAGYTIAKFDFTVSAKVEDPAGKTITVTWGDLTGEGTIDTDDAKAALYYFANLPKTYIVDGVELTVGDNIGVQGSATDAYKWGDITGDGKIDTDDAKAALYHFANVAKEYTINGQTITVGDDNITVGLATTD